MKITAKVIMERLNQIEDAAKNEVEEESWDRSLHDLEIRQEMRVEHAKGMLALGLDVERISSITGLKVDYINELNKAMRSEDSK